MCNLKDTRPVVINELGWSGSSLRVKEMGYICRMSTRENYSVL